MNKPTDILTIKIMSNRGQIIKNFIILDSRVYCEK
jgi:uncharacterized protein (UPF0333 family)